MNNGGPAFPVYFPEHEGHEEYCQSGMSLRDYFAGQALAAVADMMRDNTPLYPESVATAAYAIADAMLKARGDV